MHDVAERTVAPGGQPRDPRTDGRRRARTPTPRTRRRLEDRAAGAARGDVQRCGSARWCSGASDRRIAGRLHRRTASRRGDRSSRPRWAQVSRTMNGRIGSATRARSDGGRPDRLSTGLGLHRLQAESLFVKAASQRVARTSNKRYQSYVWMPAYLRLAQALARSDPLPAPGRTRTNLAGRHRSRRALPADWTS